MGGVRWAFPCASWRPRREEWLLAARLVQPEEKERIGRLVFARDAKAALVPEGTGRGAPGVASSGWPRAGLFVEKWDLRGHVRACKGLEIVNWQLSLQVRLRGW